MRSRNLWLIALGLTAVNLFIRSTTWRHEYIKEIIGHTLDKLRFKESELLAKYIRRNTGVNLHTAFMNLYRSYGTNLAQLKYNLSDTILLLDRWLLDDPAGTEAYSECIDYLDELRDYLDNLDPNPSLVRFFKPNSNIKKDIQSANDNSIETLLDGEDYLQILFG